MARYRIVPEKSQVWIEAKSNVHPIHSHTDGVEGFIELSFDSEGRVDSGGTPAGKLSLAVSRLSSGNRMEDRELQKRVEARKFPSIEGVLDKLEASGDNGSYQVCGEISFKGVSHRYEDHMTIDSVGEDTVKLAGASNFDIRDFGMEPPKILMLKVDPEVNVRVELVATKESV